jgi:hypothetical protein
MQFSCDSTPTQVLANKLGAAVLGCPLVESPQWPLACLRCQRRVQAVREIGQSLVEQLQRDFESGDYVNADEVIDGLQRKLDAAHSRPAE